MTSDYTKTQLPVKKLYTRIAGLTPEEMEKVIRRASMKIIGIVGSRRRNSTADFDKVKQTFQNLYEDGDHIVSGGCPQGADRFAEVIAKSLQVPIMIHYARWDKLGKAAGFIRNGDIAEDADILIACVAEDRTGGTEDTIRKFLARPGISKEDLYLV